MKCEGRSKTAGWRSTISLTLVGRYGRQCLLDCKKVTGMATTRLGIHQARKSDFCAYKVELMLPFVDERDLLKHAGASVM